MKEDASSTNALRWTRSDWFFIGALLLVACGLRAWHLTHTVVTARDSIHYARVAWHLGHRPVSEWSAVFRSSEQHPGYPITVWWAYLPVRATIDAAEPYRMQLATQFSSSLASILLIFPMYLIGRRFGDRRVGFGAALLLQCLPVSARLFGDGLSEGLFLFFAATSLYFAVRAVQIQRAPWSFAFVGIFSALSYWVRPEGALVAAATGLVLLASQLVRHRRRSWGSLLINGSALCIPAILIVLPYVLAIGHLTGKPTGKRILNEGDDNAGPITFERASLSPRHVEPKVASLSSAPWAIWWKGSQDPSLRKTWAVKVLFLELVEAGFYAGAILPLFAWGWWLRKRQWPSPSVWVMIIICLVLMVLLWHVAVVGGYLSSRHTLLIILCCSFSSVIGLIGLTEIVAKFCRRPLRKGSAWALALTILFALSMLPKTMKPLHKDRTGFREVGEWLAKNTHPTDPVLDPYRWSHYYSGRVFLEGSELTTPPGHVPKEYVVIEQAGNPHKRLRHLPPVIHRVERHPNPETVYQKEFSRGKKQASMTVYALPVR